MLDDVVEIPPSCLLPFACFLADTLLRKLEFGLGVAVSVLLEKSNTKITQSKKDPLELQSNHFQGFALSAPNRPLVTYLKPVSKLIP
jgi:hypothetical protein